MRFALVNILFFFSSFVYAAEDTNDYELPGTPLCDSEFYSELLDNMNVPSSQEGVIFQLDDEFVFIPSETDVQASETKVEKSTFETLSSGDSIDDGRRRNPKRSHKLPKESQIEILCVKKAKQNTNVNNNNVNNNVENFTAYDRAHFPQNKEDTIEIMIDWDNEAMEQYFQLPDQYSESAFHF